MDPFRNNRLPVSWVALRCVELRQCVAIIVVWMRGRWDGIAVHCMEHDIDIDIDTKPTNDQRSTDGITNEP